MITEPHLNSFELPVGSTPPLLDIQVRRSRTIIDIALIGDLDLSTTPELWATFSALLLDEEEDLASIVVDLSKLNYVDSTGLGCFVAAHRRCSSVEIELSLSKPDIFLTRLFELTGLDHLFAATETAAGT